MKELINIMKKSPLFETLNFSSKKIQKLLSYIFIKDFPKNSIIYEKRQPAEYVYIVLSGEVGIFFSNINNQESDQNKINSRFFLNDPKSLLSIHGKGSIFGEVSFLAGETHSSTAICLTKCKIAHIPGQIFLELLEADHNLAIKTIKLLSSRFRQRIGNIETHIGKIVSCLYPDIPERNFKMIRTLAYSTNKEIQESVIVIYFQKGWENDEENLQLFNKLYKNSEDELIDYCEELNKENKVYFLNGISLLKEEFNEHKLIDFLSCLRRYFSIIFIEVPSLDYMISQVFLRICNHILFFQRYGITSIAIKELYLEQFNKQKYLDQQNKILFIYEKSIKEKTPFEEADKENIYYLKTFIEEDLEPQEDRSLRRFVRVLLNRSRGLTLGGGGARALAHIGCIEIFESEGIEFDAVVGSSMGAVIGALYSMGLSSLEIRKMVEKYLPKSDAILDKNIPTVSFFKGNKLNHLLDNVFEDMRIEELEIPFYCTATDLTTGKMIVFDRGFIDFALRCSVSLPGVYPPIKYGEYVLVDGSVLNNLPGEVLKHKGYHKIMGINVTPLVDPISSQIEKEKGLKGIYEYYSLPPILNIINRSIAIQGRELLKFQLQFFNFILNPDITEFGLFDFHLREQIIEKGKEEALNKLPQIREIFLDN
ncbi:MAG: alpha/beta hydrolase [Leptospiraceae bacterium]|nr:MAG: alpha/beta hydrolase [Leptospiraceae bacterium]